MAYRRKTLGTIARLIGRPEDVEDVAQEVFLRLYFSLDQLRTPEGFEKRDVVLGDRDGGMVEISSGLAAGETIAASNTFQLKAELSKPGDED